MTSKSPARTIDDTDEITLNYAQIKAIATGNPKLQEYMDLEIDVNKLKMLFANFQDNRLSLQADIATLFPKQIRELESSIECLEMDKALADNSKESDFSISIEGKLYTDKNDAGKALLDACRKIRPDQQSLAIGEYRGFKMDCSFDAFTLCYRVKLRNDLPYTVELGNSELGNLTRIDNALNSIDKKIESAKSKLSEINHNYEVAKMEVQKTFPLFDEMTEKEQRLIQLGNELSVDDDHDDNSDAPQQEQKNTKNKDEQSL
jgi:hypothetical protein